MDTGTRVWNVLAKWCDLPAGPRSNDLSLADLALDSLTLFEIEMALSKEFAMPLPEGQINKKLNVGDLIALVEAAIVSANGDLSTG